MTRKLHLISALIAGVFILLAALTGAILAGESVYNQTLPYKSAEFENTTLAQTLTALKEKQIDALKMSIDRNHFVKVETTEGKTLFIHPQSAEVIQGTYETPKFIQWVKTLHRSLFLGKTGRVVMGLIALCFVLILLSGLWYIARKQLGWQNFFKKLPKGEKFNNHYHTAVGRWVLIPLLIIALTGVYMGLETVGIISKYTPTHHYDASTLPDTPVVLIANIEAFNVPLSEVRKVDFPAFEDVEEVYKVDFINKNIEVNQFTGEVISSSVSATKALSYLVRTLHIGKGHPIWAIVLLLSALAVLFFIYTGFAITLKKQRKKKPINPFPKGDCTYIVLVGTEGGTTRNFARLVHDELLRQGKKSFLAEMNRFTNYPQMEQLLIFTSTYGDGDAPTTATYFTELFKQYPIVQPFGYTVVGFGSLTYPLFCQYAREVDMQLAKLPHAQAMTPLHTINEQSFEAFNLWVQKWSASQNLTLRLSAAELTRKKRKSIPFTVIERTPVADDNIFLLRLQPAKKVTFTSGDLLSITPADLRERLYSVAQMQNGDLLLSIKLIPDGVVTNYLNTLKEGDTLQGAIVLNEHFHFPKDAPEVACIANGSGMAPFLGMIAHNTAQKPLTLVWGCRNADALKIYQPYTDAFTAEGKLTNYWQALSREADRFYVQDLIKQHSDFFAQLLSRGGVIMICGSLAMLKAVRETLDELCRFHLRQPLSHYEHQGQLKTDCY